MTVELDIITRDLHLISTNLSQSLHLDDIIYSFLEKKIISLKVYDQFMVSHESDICRAQHLVKYVAKNPHTIKIFIEALLKEGLKEIAEHISPKTVSFLPSLTGNGINSEVLPYIPARFDGPCSPITPHQSAFSDFCDGNVPLKIKVKGSYRKFGCETTKDIYKNCSKPRGFLFIVNFDSFENETYPARPGSNIDVKNLQELFTQIGYNIIGPFINPTKFELVREIEDFSQSKSLADVDSCVVAIMSHGKGEMAFLTSDNKVINYQEILEFLNNKRCPALFGKPKVFIFQCCRGPIADEGVGIAAQFVSHTSERSQTDAVFCGTSMPLTSSPSFTDMYIIHSSLTGFVSYRCPERGSWLIEAICVEFMENSCDKDLESLLRLVSRRLKSLYSDKGKKQICETRNVGFDKLLYFNPISTKELVSSTNVSQAKPMNSSRSAGENEAIARSEPQEFDEPDAMPMGSAGHYKTFRMKRNDTSSQTLTKNKRQLPNYSDADGLNLCHSLMDYLQINNMADMLVTAEEIKKEIQKKKPEHKRKKMEDETKT